MRKVLSTSAVARLLGVAVASVSNWIDQGELRAGRTPGGHRRVEVEDLIEFLRRQKLRIPPELMPEPPKVLIVDDEQPIAELLREELSEALPGCEILLANDGFAAGEVVAGEHPDVVILDLFMPGMDGFEVCRRIKSRKSTRAIAVIAITARPSDDVRERITQAGACAFLPKPLDMDLLRERTREALREAGRPAGAVQAR